MPWWVVALVALGVAALVALVELANELRMERDGI